MTGPDRRPWDAPDNARVDAAAAQAGQTVADTIRGAYRDGYADGWFASGRESGARVVELDRRILAMTLDLAGEAGRVAYLRAEVDRLAPEAAQARTLAAALARAEEEVLALKREVAHLKRLAGLPEGM